MRVLVLAKIKIFTTSVALPYREYDIEIDRTISYGTGTYFQIILKLVLLKHSSLNKKMFDFIELITLRT